MVARHTNRAVVAPAPLLKSRRPVRQRFENQRQAPEVGQLSKKRMFCGNLAVLRFFAAGTRGDPVRFLARRGRLPQGVAFGRRTLGVESARIAVSAQRIRNFPRPSKGNSAPLNAVRVSRRYEQRTRPGRRFRGRPAQHRQRRVAVAPSRRAARPDAAAGGDYRSQGRVEHPVRQLVSHAAFHWPGTVNRSGRARRGRDAPVQEDRGRRWTISRSTCPSTPVRRREIFPDVDSTDDPVHGNQKGRHGYSCCYLPLYRDDLGFAVAACERRPGGGRGGGAGAGALAGDRRSRRRRAATGRGAKTTESMTCCPATPA